MIALDETFWLNRRVLITGHTGFKGTYLASWLSELGADLIGLAHPPTLQAQLHYAAGLESRMSSITGDIRDREQLSHIVATREPEIIFHLAAQSLVLPGLKNPTSTFDVNVQGTLNLLEAARRSRDLRAVIVVTSDKCYRPRAEPCFEDDPLGGSDPYAASKACAELIAQSYRTCYLTPEDGIGLATVRAGNVIGGGDLSPHRLMADLVRAARAGQPVRLRHPEAIRPWQHVLDALHGYLLLAQACARRPTQYSGAWNLGPVPEDHWTVAKVAEHVVRQLGGGIEVHPPVESLETPTLRLATEKVEQRIGWRPALSTEEAIDWTVAGYRRLLDERDGAWLYEQIARFEERTEIASRAAANTHRHRPEQQYEVAHAGARA